MPRFSTRSLSHLAECDERLQRVAHRAIKITDFTVYEGHRGRAEQNRYYRTGKSQLPYPRSKHNRKPSLAFDCAPYPINWKELERFYFLAGVLMACAAEEGVKLRWGGDWDRDQDFYDSSFRDLPHFELVE